jgi:hypothetical protein
MNSERRQNCAKYQSPESLVIGSKHLASTPKAREAREELCGSFHFNNTLTVITEFFLFLIFFLTFFSRI